MPFNVTLTTPICVSGDRADIPASTETLGRASLDVGFPPETSRPLAQGGYPPRREDFNGIFYLLSGNIINNAEAIEKNTADIAANKTAIEDNADKIQQNTTNISLHTEAIAENKTAIQTNAEAIEKNTADIAAIASGGGIAEWVEGKNYTAGDMVYLVLNDSLYSRTRYIFFTCKQTGISTKSPLTDFYGWQASYGAYQFGKGIELNPPRTDPSGVAAQPDLTEPIIRFISSSRLGAFGTVAPYIYGLLEKPNEPRSDCENRFVGSIGIHTAGITGQGSSIVFRPQQTIDYGSLYYQAPTVTFGNAVLGTPYFARVDTSKGMLALNAIKFGRIGILEIVANYATAASSYTVTFPFPIKTLSHSFLVRNSTTIQVNNIIYQTNTDGLKTGFTIVLSGSFSSWGGTVIFEQNDTYLGGTDFEYITS